MPLRVCHRPEGLSLPSQRLSLFVSLILGSGFRLNAEFLVEAVLAVLVLVLGIDGARILAGIDFRLRGVRGCDHVLEHSRWSSRPLRVIRESRHRVIPMQVQEGRVEEGGNWDTENRPRNTCHRA